MKKICSVVTIIILILLFNAISVFASDCINITGHKYNLKYKCDKNAMEFTCSYCNDSYSQEIEPISISLERTGSSYAVINGYGTYSRNYKIIATGGYGLLQYMGELYTSSTATSPIETFEFSENPEFSVSNTGTSFAAGNKVISITVRDNYGFLSKAKFKISDESLLKHEILGDGHSYTETIIPPTEEERGYTLHSCSCGHSYKDNFTIKIIDKGTCGDDVVWKLDAEGTLNISGTGWISSYYDKDSSRAPWYSLRERILTVVIDDGITHIGTYTFNNCINLNSVVIPRYCSIGTATFRNCKNLTEISLPETETIIPQYTFYGCEKLSKIYMSGVRTISKYSFAYCKSLTSINIPSRVTAISDYAFYNCTGLTNVKFHNSVISIGKSAFFNNDSLINISLPKSIEVIGEEAFGGCDNLSSIVVDENNPFYSSHDGVLFDKTMEILVQYPPARKTSNYTVPSSVTKIGGYAFQYCTTLTNIDISNAVTDIGEYAFQHCTALTSVKIPANVTIIKERTFGDCSGLTSINMPNNITEIQNNAFYGCSKLINIDIPNSVISIGKSAFSRCTSLKKITIPEKVTFIGNFAFSNCRALTELKWNAREITDFSDAYHSAFDYVGQDGVGVNVIFGDSVEVIPRYLFYTSIESTRPKIANLHIGNSVCRIKSYAFAYCANLQNIIIPRSVTVIESSAFVGWTDLQVVYYCGDENGWKNIQISIYNVCFMNANIIYCNITSCFIIFDANNGINAPMQQRTEGNSNIKLTNEVPTRGNYKFLGWSRLPNATEPEYKSGDSITIGVEDITLYAVWQRIVITNSTIVNNIIMVTPTNAQTGDCIIVACYRQFKMVYMDMYSYNNEEIIPFTPDAEYDTIKIMVREKANILKPLGKVEKILVTP